MSRNDRSRALRALLFAGFVVAPIDVYAGELDLAFGNGGRVVTDASNRYDEVRALAIHTDGRIVAVGVAGTASAQDFVLARYNSDGTLDRSFGGSGSVVTDFSGGSDAAWAVTIQSDGKIVAAGIADGDFALARYDVNGALDSQFGIDGKATIDFGGYDRASGLALQQDGKIVVVGNAAGLDIAVARVNGDGTLDATFGNMGTVVTDLNDNIDSASTVAVQSNGMVVTAGYTGRFPSARFVLVRYRQDGTLDENFGTNGKVTVEFGRHATAHAIAIQPDGKLVIEGFIDNGSSRDGVISRHNTDGTLDTTFGTNGMVVTDFGGRNFGSAVALYSDGRFVVAGFDDVPPYYDFVIAQYAPEGELDVTFGTGGRVLTEFEGNSWINAVAIQEDGKIVAAGYVRSLSGADFALVRYLSVR